MNLGTAIKTIRKQMGFSQRELAEKCNISVNALCQIEINNTFPQKSTINKICEVLEVPTSYLLFFSISDEDVPVENRNLFNSLKPTIKNLLLKDIA